MAVLSISILALKTLLRPTALLIAIMNLSQNPTEAQLAALIAACDDKAGDHLVWVREDGEVTISPLPEGVEAREFAEGMGASVRFWMETYPGGEGYVGALASRDLNAVSLLYCDLRVGLRKPPASRTAHLLELAPSFAMP